MKTQPAGSNNASNSNSFVQRYRDRVMGILHGFDRLRLRGTLRQLYSPSVMEAYLSTQHILLKQFGQLVQATSQQVKRATEALAEKLGRPVVYVGSSVQSIATGGSSHSSRGSIGESTKTRADFIY